MESQLNTFRSDFEDFSVVEGLLRPRSLLSGAVAAGSPNHYTGLGEGRVTDPLSLRSSTRNAIVTYSALQKVFRARFEEGRSHSNLEHLSNLNPDQPFVTAGRPKYEAMLGKTRSNFSQVLSYQKNLAASLGGTAFLKNSTNFFFFSFPFLLAPKSDMGRYIWFDWYAK